MEGSTGPAVQAAGAAVTITVSVVVYHPDVEVLTQTLQSLRNAAERAIARGVIRSLAVDLVDNGSPQEAVLDLAVERTFADARGLRVHTLRGHGNVGYGQGHNLSILASTAAYHLVLNPDVIVHEDAVVEAVRFMDRHPDVALLNPEVMGEDGERQYLCRRYPSVTVFFLRSFAPRAVRRLFRPLLHRYEMRDVIGDDVVRGVPLVSGCFMFARRDVLAAVGGFSPAYFMYMEDYHLCMAIRRHADIAYVPSVRIVHFGGGVARKGHRHVSMMLRSVFTFFRLNGWRLV